MAMSNPNQQYTSYARPPGPQQPGKYPFTGQMYAIYGEQPGYLYNPWNDKYVPDPNAVKQYEQSVGLGDPKPPSLAETILPIAGVAGAIYGAKAIGEELPAYLKEAGGLFSLGGGTTAATGPTIGANVSTSGALTTPQIVGASRLPVEAGADNAGLLGSLGPTAQGAIGAAGLGLGLYGLKEAYENQSPVMGAASGAGAALGGGALASALGASAVPGVGWLAGGGALLGLGVGLLGGLFDKDEWKRERKRLEGLKEEGVFVPDELIAAMPTKGRSKEELVAIEQQKVAQGGYGNPTFAQTRDEKDLQPLDIVNYSAFAENDPQWFSRPMPERLAYADSALRAGAVREHHGTIDIDFSKIGSVPPMTSGSQAQPRVAEAQGQNVALPQQAAVVSPSLTTPPQQMPTRFAPVPRAPIAPPAPYTDQQVRAMNQIRGGIKGQGLFSLR